MFTRAQCSRLFVILFAVVQLAGCGNERPKLHPAQGKVTYQGQAVKNASVLFQPQKGPVATGVTNESGEFTLLTNGESGAVEGSHKVSISAVSSGTVNMSVEDYEKTGDLPEIETRSLIPEKYGNFETSGLTAAVTSSPPKNAFNFELSE